MADSYVTFTLHLDGVPATVHPHCSHDGGSMTYRVEAVHSGSIYLQGSIEQLRAFARAIQIAANEAALHPDFAKETVK